jgi:hypothetical protein
MDLGVGFAMATPPSRNSLLPVPTAVAQPPTPPDVVALSHLRWDFVFQRPQHLLTRCARRHRSLSSRSPSLPRARRDSKCRSGSTAFMWRSHAFPKV